MRELTIATAIATLACASAPPEVPAPVTRAAPAPDSEATVAPDTGEMPHVPDSAGRPADRAIWFGFRHRTELRCPMPVTVPDPEASVPMPTVWLLPGRMPVVPPGCVNPLFPGTWPRQALPPDARDSLLERLRRRPRR